MTAQLKTREINYERWTVYDIDDRKILLESGDKETTAPRYLYRFLIIGDKINLEQ